MVYIIPVYIAGSRHNVNDMDSLKKKSSFFFSDKTKI